MRIDLSVKEYNLVSIKSDSETERFLRVQVSSIIFISVSSIFIDGRLLDR